MKRELVQSSNIASIGYDAALQILEVQFKGGLLWQYSEVAPEEHRALMSAPSIGSHFMKHIRGRKEGGPVVEVRPPASAFEDCAKAVEEYQDAAFADRYRQRLPKHATPPEVKDKDRALGVGDICAQVLAAKRAIAPKGIE